MKGQVFGLVVRSCGLGGNIMAGLRSIGGGEITEYTELLEDARRHAVDRMVQNATAMRADAVIRMQYDSSEIGNTMSEIVAYGTAAVIEPGPRLMLCKAILVMVRWQLSEPSPSPWPVSSPDSSFTCSSTASL